jgi:hypothetical protein
LLQNMSGEPQSECFHIVFHSTIIQSIWLNVKWLPSVLSSLPIEWGGSSRADDNRIRQSVSHVCYSPNAWSS